MLFVVLSSLFVTVAPPPPQIALACTDGLDCFCDCVQNDYDGTGPPAAINTANDIVVGSDTFANAACLARGTPVATGKTILTCTDFEQATFHDDLVTDQVYYNEQNQSIGRPLWSDNGNPGVRAFGGAWSTHWNDVSVIGQTAWQQDEPSVPVTRGVQCSQNACSSIIYSLDTTIDAAWQSDELPEKRCFTVAQHKDLKTRIGSLSDLTGGRVANSSIFDGNQMMAYTVPYGETPGCPGTNQCACGTGVTIDFNWPIDEVGMIWAEAYPSNIEASTILERPWKPAEFRDQSSPRANNFVTGWTTSGSDPNNQRLPFRGYVYGDADGWCVGNHTPYVGTYQCDAGSNYLYYWPEDSVYQFDTDWDWAKWGCIRAHMTGLTTTNATLKVWFGEELVYHYGFNPTGTDADDGWEGYVLNAFANMNQNDGWDTTQETYRYLDNLVAFEGSEPPTCADIGLVGAHTSATGRKRYLTHFNGTEDPLSEGGAWVNNSPWNEADETGWKQPVTNGRSYVYGTHCDDQCAGGACYNDSSAHLTGFTADHAVEAVVHAEGSFGPNQEVELTCRATSWNDAGTKKYTQYEFLIPYDDAWNMQIIRWNGDQGDFTLGLAQYNFFTPVQDNDRFRLECTGTNPVVVKAYWNDNQIMEATDSSAQRLETGQPGIGFYSRDSSCAQNERFGWKQLWANDI